MKPDIITLGYTVIKFWFGLSSTATIGVKHGYRYSMVLHVSNLKKQSREQFKAFDSI